LRTEPAAAPAVSLSHGAMSGGPSALSRRTVATLADFRAVRDEYVSLVAASERPLSPFVTHRWLSAFWQAYERQYQGRVLCLYAGDVLAAAVPLMYGKDVMAHMKVNRVSFLGGDWGWNEFPVRPEAAGAWAEELMGWLTKDQSAHWSFMQVGPMRVDSARTAELTRAFEARGIAYKTLEKTGPYLKLAGSWDEFLAGKSRNFRRTIKRKETAAEEAGITVRRIVNPTPDEMRATVFDVSRRSWQGVEGKAVASSEEGRRFYELLAAGQGELTVDITAAYQGDTCVAYLLGVTHGPVYHAFDTGFDPAFAEQSPGLLVHFASMKELFGTGVEEFNFGFAHSYKERFEPENHAAVEFQLFRTRWSGAFGSLVDQAKRVLDRG